MDDFRVMIVFLDPKAGTIHVYVGRSQLIYGVICTAFLPRRSHSELFTQSGNLPRLRDAADHPNAASYDIDYAICDQRPPLVRMCEQLSHRHGRCGLCFDLLEVIALEEPNDQWLYPRAPLLTKAKRWLNNGYLGTYWEVDSGWRIDD